MEKFVTTLGDSANENIVAAIANIRLYQEQTGKGDSNYLLDSLARPQLEQALSLLVKTEQQLISDIKLCIEECSVDNDPMEYVMHTLLFEVNPYTVAAILKSDYSDLWENNVADFWHEMVEKYDNIRI